MSFPTDFPPFTVEQLSQFSGRPLQAYSPYANQALAQAILIFMIVTELRAWPTDQYDQMLATNGILAYADTLVLAQPYSEAVASPFQSMSSGSVSWSKPITQIRGAEQALALQGEATGIKFFDLAVQKLAKRTERGGVFSNSIGMKWEDEVFARIDHETGEVQIVGPAQMDSDTFLGWSDWNSDSWPGMENPPGGTQW
jgi:hypothetical protein